MPAGILGQILKRLRVKEVPAHLSRSEESIQEVVRPSAELILVVRGVGKAFKGVQALAGVDLEVRRGEILGLVGPNGSGKSTLINVVSGHYAVDGGSIRFEGEELVGKPAHRIARAGIARTYQIPRPFPQMTVLQNVALPPMFGQVVMDRTSAEAEAWRWLEFTGLEGKAHRLPSDLNLRKKISRAGARARVAPKLFLDEVLSGLTPTEMDGPCASSARSATRARRSCSSARDAAVMEATTGRRAHVWQGDRRGRRPGSSQPRRRLGLPGGGACMK